MFFSSQAVKRILAFLFPFWVGSGAWAGAPELRVFVDGEESPTLQAGVGTDLILEIYDPNAVEPYHHFHEMHERPLHFIAISRDLEQFSHMHPAPLGNHTGLFGLRVNDPTYAQTDPYNRDAAGAFTKTGGYFLFAEAMPMGGNMVVLPADLDTLVRTSPATALQPDPIDAQGRMVKVFNDFKVTTELEIYSHCGAFAPFLKIDLSKFDPGLGDFAPVTNLDTYLGAFAHAVMISESGDAASRKTFAHLHTVWPLPDDPTTERGPYLEVTVDTHGKLFMPGTKGMYRTWLQFKLGGQVQTIPLTFEMAIPDLPDSKCRTRE